MFDRFEIVYLVELQVNLILGYEGVICYQSLDKFETINVQLAFSWHQSYLLRPLFGSWSLSLLCQPFFSSCVGNAILFPPLKNCLKLFEINIVLICDSTDRYGFLGHVCSRLLHLFEFLDDHLHILLCYSFFSLFRTATTTDGTAGKWAEGITNWSIFWEVLTLFLQFSP